MKRWFVVALFCLTATYTETSEASRAKKIVKSIFSDLVNITKSLTNVFVDTEATVKTSPTKIRSSLLMVLEVNDKRGSGVSLDSAADLVTIGIQ